jgi:DNA-binding MarR family transcriptional regulator
MNTPTDDALFRTSDSRPRAEVDITLGMLSAVEENSVVTQRSLAKELGIALGLANAYLRRCVSKGLIKVTHAPANRYAYYLTPKGFAEKSRLTAQYLALSFDFFRAARAQCHEIVAECRRQGWRRIVLCGGGELAEIMMLCAEGEETQLVGLFETSGGSHVGRLPIIADPKAIPEVDAAIITDQRTPQETYDRMVKLMPRERVLAPRILNISRVPPTLAED